MNEIKNLKISQVNNYMSNFYDLKDINVDQIKEGLINILGEEPGVEFEYGTEHFLNETTGTDDRRNELKKINIFYTYIDDLNKMPRAGKISYIVG